MSAARPRAFPIPALLNVGILAAATAACIGLLWLASHDVRPAVVTVAAVAFSFTANTLFSLLHEAVHGVFHPDPAINRWAGRWAASFFPTSFGLQRGMHLVHHRNNRGETERFDYISPGDVAWLRYAQWYSILTGLYWVISVAGVAIYFVTPAGVRNKTMGASTWRRTDSRVATQTASREYLAVFDDLDPVTTRLEVLGAIGLHAALFLGFDLTVAGWAACYGAFGLHWSSLQYADHAFSPLHRTDGAWDLDVNPISRAFFLNYHDHRAHHRNPRAPWIHLPDLVDQKAERPTFFGVWRSMWAGPRPLPAEARGIADAPTGATTPDAPA